MAQFHIALPQLLVPVGGTQRCQCERRPSPLSPRSRRGGTSMFHPLLARYQTSFNGCRQPLLLQSAARGTDAGGSPTFDPRVVLRNAAFFLPSEALPTGRSLYKRLVSNKPKLSLLPFAEERCQPPNSPALSPLPPSSTLQSEPLIDAARAERDRSAAIQWTFSSFTQSYSITTAGGAVADSGPQDGAPTEKPRRHKGREREERGELWNRRIIEL